jgi:hypothetical protein
VYGGEATQVLEPEDDEGMQGVLKQVRTKDNGELTFWVQQ